MVPPWEKKKNENQSRDGRDMKAIGTTQDEVHDRTSYKRILSAAATSPPPNQV